jgi:AcrR family transcriptional regulator
MLDEGYPAVTTRRLETETRLNKSLVYYYFGTMDGLFIALFRRNAERTLRLATESLNAGQPLWALWDLAHRGMRATLTTEFNAVAHHRKALRAEIALYSGRFRDVEIASVEGSLRRADVDEAEWPAPAVVFMIDAITRYLQIEASFEVDRGHAETVRLIEKLILGVEGPRRTGDLVALQRVGG